MLRLGRAQGGVQAGCIVGRNLCWSESSEHEAVQPPHRREQGPHVTKRVDSQQGLVFVSTRRECVFKDPVGHGACLTGNSAPLPVGWASTGEPELSRLSEKTPLTKFTAFSSFSSPLGLV